MKKWLIFWMLWCCLGIGLTLAGCCINEKVLWSIHPFELMLNYGCLAFFIWLYREEEKRDDRTK